MRSRPILLILSACAAIAAEPLGPGGHADLDPGYAGYPVRYSVYIPPAHAQTVRGLPALFLVGDAKKPPGGTAQADRLGLIKIRVDGLIQSVGDELNRRCDAVIAHLGKQGVKVHPLLRYSMGFSAGGQAAAIMASGHGDAWAGVAQMAHSGAGNIAPKHVAVAIFCRRDDTVQPFDRLSDVAQMYRQRGNPVRFEVLPGGHGDGCPGQMYDAFTEWMLLQTVVAHPRLTPEDRKEGSALIERLAADLAAESDAAKRIDGCRSLLEAPGVAASPAGRTLRALWLTSAFAAADAATEALARHNLLTDAALHPALARIDDRAAKDELAKRLAELRKDPAVATDWAARQRFAAAQDSETRAGTAKGALKEALAAYVDVANRYPATPWGEQAKAAAEALAKRLGK